MKYKKHDIEETDAGYSWCHEDFNGPEDPRWGHAKTPKECRQQIDEFIEENPELHYIELDTWLDMWETAVTEGQSSISNEEAIKRWEKEYGGF